MSFESLLIHEVTIYTVTDGTTDKYGNPVVVESAGVTYPARVQQESSTEDLDDRDTRHTVFTAFLLPDVQVTALDVVEYGGRRMRVVGEPNVQSDGIGPHHKELRLEVFEG